MSKSRGNNPVSLSELNAGGFLAFDSKRIETAKAAQTQLFDTLEQFGRQQFARAKQEIELAFELSGKIASASSIPDVMNAYQSSISKRAALFVHDTQRIANAMMKLLTIGKAET